MSSLLPSEYQRFCSKSEFVLFSAEFLDCNYRRGVCVPDEDASVDCDNCVQLPSHHCGTGSHFTYGPDLPRLQKPPEKGTKCMSFILPS